MGTALIAAGFVAMTASDTFFRYFLLRKHPYSLIRFSRHHFEFGRKVPAHMRWWHFRDVRKHV